MVDYEQNAKTYLSENLRIISAVWKIDQLEFSELLGLQKATFNNYVNRVSFPKVPTLMLMADITGFSIDTLLRGHVPVEQIPPVPISPGKTPTSMVQEKHAEYRTTMPAADLQKRIEKIEQQIGYILEQLPGIAKRDEK